MFGFTRKTDYALVALATLAKDAASRRQPVSAKRIAQQYSLPLPLMMQLLKALHRSGVVDSIRGATGGYYLARPADQIDLIQVVEAIEDPVRVAPCCDEHKEDRCVACVVTQRCPIVGNVRRLNEKIVSFLGQVTIQDLIEPDPLVAPGFSSPIGHNHEETDGPVSLGPPASSRRGRSRK